MKLHKADYYVGGLSAFNRHSLSNQIPIQLTVYNDKICGLKKFGKLLVQFIKVSKRHIIGFDILPIPANQNKINISNLAKTILDAINDYKRYHTLPEAYLWLKKYSTNKIFLHDFLHLAINSAKNNTLRRIGFYLEQLGIKEECLLSINEKLTPIKAWIPLIPSDGYQGKTNKKWRIINNAKQFL